MKTKIASMAMIAFIPAKMTALATNTTGYLIGAIISLLIMGYLVYTLIRPEKF
jgi:K+-transporting ATPase KdpF subunit